MGDIVGSERRPNVYLVYSGVVRAEDRGQHIGGIQTYLVSLATVVRGMGWSPTIVQRGRPPFDFIRDEVRYRGFSVGGAPDDYRPLYGAIESEISPERDIVVWGSQARIPTNPRCRSIGIQHGVGFDMLWPVSEHQGVQQLVRYRIPAIYKALQRRKAVHRFRRMPERVCVDYNFLNWYRTYAYSDGDQRTTVIPNFAPIPTLHREDRTTFSRILFARRFSYERGTLVAIEASRLLLERHAGVVVTFAGDGPLRPSVESLRDEYPDRVKLTTYEMGESVRFHQSYDISMVPSLGSEGTSLSALEAMAAGCVVVCSNVGGLTNIVLDGHNGVIIPPTTEALAEAIETILGDHRLAARLGANAAATAAESFSRARWVERWESVLRREPYPRP